MNKPNLYYDPLAADSHRLASRFIELFQPVPITDKTISIDRDRDVVLLAPGESAVGMRAWGNGMPCIYTDFGYVPDSVIVDPVGLHEHSSLRTAWILDQAKLKGPDYDAYVRAYRDGTTDGIPQQERSADVPFAPGYVLYVESLCGDAWATAEAPRWLRSTSNFVYRGHPRGEYRAPMHQDGNPYQIRALIAKAGAVVVGHSRVGFESLLLDKPVITLEPSFISRRGITFDAFDLETLKAATLSLEWWDEGCQLRQRKFCRYVVGNYLFLGRLDTEPNRTRLLGIIEGQRKV
jgi:hypothetical protein